MQAFAGRWVLIVTSATAVLLTGGMDAIQGLERGGGAPEATPVQSEPAPGVTGLTINGDPPDPTEVSDELKAIYRHIDANFDTHLERLLKWIRIPSISNTVEGKPAIWESAEFIRDIIVEDLGCTAEIYSPGIADWGAPGHPVVYGRCDVGAEKTIIDYGMGDVMPIFRPELWELPPFAGQMKERPPYRRVLVGRGASNHKGKDMAEINALISMKAATGTLPANVIFAIEHDEERMDLGLRKLMFDHPELFKDADAVFGHGSTQLADGRGVVSGPMMGIAVFDLATSGAPGLWRANQPVWRHFQMLRSLFHNESPLIQEIAKDVLPPDEEEVAHLRREAQANDGNPSFEELMKRRTGIRVTITGVWGGNMAPGYAGRYTPRVMTSKIDIRFPPNVDGGDIFSKVRRHVDQQGYQDVSLREIGVYSWSWGNAETEIAQAVTAMFKQFNVPYNEPPKGNYLGPVTYGGPNFLFTKGPLKLPVVMAGLGGYGGGAHADNEWVVINGDGKKMYGFAGAMKGFATILYNYAGKNQPLGNEVR